MADDEEVRDPNTGLTLAEAEADRALKKAARAVGRNRNRKRSRKLDTLAWQSVDIPLDMYMGFTSGGFGGLQEVVDYDDAFIQNAQTIEAFDGDGDGTATATAAASQADGDATEQEVARPKKKKHHEKRRKKKRKVQANADADADADDAHADTEATTSFDATDATSAPDATDRAGAQSESVELGSGMAGGHLPAGKTAGKKRNKKKKAKNKAGGPSDEAQGSDAVAADAEAATATAAAAEVSSVPQAGADSADQSVPTAEVTRSTAQKTSKKKKKAKSKQAPEGAAGIPDAPLEAVAVAVADMSAWSGFFLPDVVVSNLASQGFSKPTPIQAAAIPAALMQRRDILAAAETGSGKTLAFGVPIVAQLIEQQQRGQLEQRLHALVITPTRELALQVQAHIKTIAQGSGIKIAAIVGGLAPQKQTRVLASKPEIVVATPGRLWDLMSSSTPHFRDIRRLAFLVIDEADKMVERGHFKEVKQILEWIMRPVGTIETDDTAEADADADADALAQRQTFIFSATLFSNDEHMTKKTKNVNNPIAYITGLCKLKDNYVKLDMSSAGLADGLKEARITCTREEKESVFFYFARKYPGRTLVFVNSIDSIRRLTAIFSMVGLPVVSLHANMQQRQRLKNLEKFKNRAHSILLATDVAARGLDIKGIQHVVHYQLPRDADTYVHRSGRTARALTSGLAVALVAPDDVKNYKRIMYNLNNGQDLKPFPVERKSFTGIKAILDLAIKIDKKERNSKTTSASNNWFAKQAAAMDIELDEGLLKPEIDGYGKKALNTEVAQLKLQLQSLLADNKPDAVASNGGKGKLFVAKSKRNRKAPKAKKEDALDAV